MSAPSRIQRRRTRGWRLPENSVIVSCPSRFGNPCKVGLMQEMGYEGGGVWDSSAIPAAKAASEARAAARRAGWRRADGRDLCPDCATTVTTEETP